jgi:hypothetical protein
LFFLPISTLAQDRTSEIFNRGKRVLSPPSRNLKSNSANMDYRLQSETQRINRRPDASDPTQEGDLLTQGVQPMSPVPSSPATATSDASQTKYKANSSRRDRFSSRTTVRDPTGLRIFAIGFVGAGAYGIFGTEAEFSIDEKISLGLGLGTGMTYATWGLHGKYVFNSSGRINTFFQAGYAHWYFGKVPSTRGTVKPNYLAERFFSENGNLVAGRSVDLIYPGIGVQVLGQGGLAFSTQLQYLISLRDFSGGLFGSLALHYYF